MPLKLNIAMSRKIGEPNYGSRGATVGLEMEVDSSLVDQPRQLHERIARLFRLAKQSVDRELGTSDPGRRRANRSTSDARPDPRSARNRQSSAAGPHGRNPISLWCRPTGRPVTRPSQSTDRYNQTVIERDGGLELTGSMKLPIAMNRMSTFARRLRCRPSQTAQAALRFR